MGAIIEETGLYVHEAVKTLQKEELVKEGKTRSHKQKKIQQLTELGLEVVKLISDTEHIKKSHSELKKLMVKNFGIAEDLDETQIKNKLRSRGWSPEEIPFYREFTRYAILLITEALNMVYNVLTYRYSALLLKYDIKNVARLILDRTILDALEYHISIARDSLTMSKLYYMKDENERARIVIDRLLSSVEAIEEHNPYLNKFTDKEGASLLASICSMLEAPKNIVEDYISKENSTLKVFGHELVQAGDDTHFVDGVMIKNSYNETRRIFVPRQPEYLMQSLSNL